MEPPFFPGEMVVHTPVFLMQTSASTRALPVSPAPAGLLLAAFMLNPAIRAS